MTDTAKRTRPMHSLAAPVAAIVVALAAFAPAVARAQDPIPDPSANRSPSQSTLQACNLDPAGQACVDDALADLNAARVAEGDLPMLLPGDWSSLTIPQQLLVLSNLERIDRGLVPIEGLSANLDNDAEQGAQQDIDPPFTNIYGDAATANWEGGYISPLLSDFAWMYDDGYGSGNLDCTTPTSGNCWGHRHDILWDFTAPAVMGADYEDAASSNDGDPSESEIFVGGDSQTGSGQADAPIVPTWATIAATLPVGLSATTVTLTGTTRTGQLELWASGETMNVTAAVTTGSSAWGVAPGGCQLNAGQSCELTLTARTPTPGSGTLTVTGPNGIQTVALQGPAPAPPPPVTPKLTAKLGRSKIHRGRTTTLSGTVAPYKPGTFVELQQRHGKSWRNVAKAELRLSGRFSFTIQARSKGSFSYRVSVGAATGFNGASSKTLTLRVG